MMHLITHTVCSTAGSGRTQVTNTVHFLFVRKIDLDLVTIRFSSVTEHTATLGPSGRGALGSRSLQFGLFIV